MVSRHDTEAPVGKPKVLNNFILTTKNSKLIY